MCEPERLVAGDGSELEAGRGRIRGTARWCGVSAVYVLLVTASFKRLTDLVKAVVFWRNGVCYGPPLTRAIEASADPDEVSRPFFDYEEDEGVGHTNKW